MKEIKLERKNLAKRIAMSFFGVIICAISVGIFKIAALGVPGLVLVTAIGATGLAGGAAITTALAALGPGGMLGGIVTLGIIGLVSEGIAQYGVDAIFSAVVKELYRKGETKEEILQKVNRYPISKDLKRKLKEHIEKE